MGTGPRHEQLVYVADTIGASRGGGRQLDGTPSDLGGRPVRDGQSKRPSRHEAPGETDVLIGVIMLALTTMLVAVVMLSLLGDGGDRCTSLKHGRGGVPPQTGGGFERVQVLPNRERWTNLDPAVKGYPRRRVLRRAGWPGWGRQGQLTFLITNGGDQGGSGEATAYGPWRSAELLGVPHKSLQSYWRTWGLPGTRVGKRVQFMERAVLAWIEQHPA